MTRRRLATALLAFVAIWPAVTLWLQARWSVDPWKLMSFGMYAALPVLTAFLFSFVHGAFTGSFWSALGIEASKKSSRVELPATKPAKRVRPRPRVHLNT